ncbi:MAG TPA: hypothetical protein VIJ35_31445 [Bradyrhizobium sp.]
MTPTTTIRRALLDPHLLGATLSGPSWQAWRVLLTAAMGEALDDDERALFTTLTGRAREPLRRVEELVAVVGRRGGKSRALATLACYVAGLCDHRANLAPGERGVVLCISPNQRQAAIVLNYATACFEQSPILRQLIESRTHDTLSLTNQVTIEVRAASFRRLRGPTFLAAIAGESAFWYDDSGSSANPDVEILNAVRPGRATTRGPLIIASSPYARRGVLWDAHRRHYGPDGDPMILVAQGASRDFNPSLPQSVVDRALERDRASATAEYLAQFRNDIETFVPREIVEACMGDHVEMAPFAAIRYAGFVDPSGGSSDSFTMAISHKDGERVFIDAIRETKPPFSPETTINDLAVLLKTYRIDRVTGDRYAGEFPRELFRKRGISYAPSDLPKSDLFRDLLPLLNSGQIVLPRSDRLVSQLTGLERRVSRAGRDSIDHAPGGHDDLANAVAGAASIASQRPRGGCVTYYINDGSCYVPGYAGRVLGDAPSDTYITRRDDGVVVLRSRKAAP